MPWQDVKRGVIEACGPLLEPRGYKFLRSRTTFEKPTATGRLIVRFLFIASDAGNYSVQIGCGVRHDIIERIVHQASTVGERAQSSTTTISAEWSELLYLNTSEEQAVAIARLHAYIQEVALPFLERHYTLADFSAFLNLTDSDGQPRYRTGMGTNFWQRGLAAAKLAGDRRFEDLRRHYTAHVRALNGGFYSPAFERCMRYIDENVS